MQCFAESGLIVAFLWLLVDFNPSVLLYQYHSLLGEPYQPDMQKSEPFQWLARLPLWFSQIDSLPTDSGPSSISLLRVGSSPDFSYPIASVTGLQW